MQDTAWSTFREKKGRSNWELSRSHGKDDRVIILVVGAFGETSSDVCAIIDLVASIPARKHLSYYSEYPSAIKGMFQWRYCRSFILSAHLPL